MTAHIKYTRNTDVTSIIESFDGRSFDDIICLMLPAPIREALSKMANDEGGCAFISARVSWAQYANGAARSL